MRRRRALTLHLGENDFLALRFILASHRAGNITNAKHVTHSLGISRAATAALIRRLVRRASVSRQASRRDRRSVVIRFLDRMRAALDHNDDGKS